MSLRSLGFILAVAASGSAQSVTPLTGDDTDSSLNRETLEAQRRQPTGPSGWKTAQAQRNTVVYPGDTVIPQFVDGESWNTTVTVINLENYPVACTAMFFKDDGTDMYVPVSGQGSVRGMIIRLAPAESFTFETAGEGGRLAQGWAILSQPGDDSIGMVTIFRQRVPGRPDQEAAVPTANQYDNRFVLPFDNTAFTTAVALANPYVLPVFAIANIRDAAGVIIDRQPLTLGPLQHAAFALPAAWPSTAGRRGAVEFLTPGSGLGAIGLRFNGAAFTSVPVLTNRYWIE